MNYWEKGLLIEIKEKSIKHGINSMKHLEDWKKNCSMLHWLLIHFLYSWCRIHVCLVIILAPGNLRYNTHTLHCTLYTIHCTLYTVYFTLYTVHYILYLVHCTLYTVHYSLYSVHCTVYTVNCKWSPPQDLEDTTVWLQQRV